MKSTLFAFATEGENFISQAIGNALADHAAATLRARGFRLVTLPPEPSSNDRDLVRDAESVFILADHRWQTSPGIQRVIELARETETPLNLVDPITLQIHPLNQLTSPPVTMTA